jgi:hypothetical protein
MIRMKPLQTIEAFDAFLSGRSLRFRGVVIGGTALNLLGVVSRTTRDCDILHPMLPEEIKAAAVAFAGERRRAGEGLEDGWFNNGPASFVRQLPVDWSERLVPVFLGSALKLQSLGRDDLLRSKLFALCDRGLDLSDCLALAPTAGELARLLPWVAKQDLNSEWPAHVRGVLEELGRRLGHGV